MARFQREAEALAALNHPHIAGIHDFGEAEGSRFIVMELVEGETLAERIGSVASGSALSLNETLDLAVQIADALAAAHDKGIVHRDLKPANIKITPEGRVKVLDFGLAKVREAESAAALTQSPTLLTRPGGGVLMGTAAYMSPEQAKGKDVDRTGDVWAFGCVLYEMLTGRAVFEGETVGEILGEIFKTEPDWSRRPAETPPGIRRLLQRCLRKDRVKRLQHMGDARIEIEDARNEPAPAPAVARDVAPSKRRRAERWAWGVAAALGVLALGLAGTVLWMRQPVSEAPEMRVEITAPPSPDLLSIAISPDGQSLVFVATFEGRRRLAIRSLQRAVVQPLAGTDNAEFPFWSPDSKSIGFFADLRLKRVDVAGGLVQTLAQAAVARGGTWKADGVILFSPGGIGPLLRVPAGGGAPEPVSRLELQKQTSHRFPQFLPDGRHFVFFAQGTSVEFSGVYLGALDGTEPRRLLSADTAAVVGAPGQLLFVRQGTLFSQGLDPDQAALIGDAVPVAEGVVYDPSAFVAGISAAATGALAYRTGAAAERQPLWFDRLGKQTGRVGWLDTGTPNNLNLSPDGARIVLDRQMGLDRDIWLSANAVSDRLTFDAAIDMAPIWSHDGTSIIFGSNRKGSYHLYRRASSNAGSDELLSDAQQANKLPQDTSSDGRFLLYRYVDPTTGRDLWALPLGGDRKAFPVVATKTEEREGQFSPRWKVDSVSIGRDLKI